jgi:hypothetical protein
MLRDIVTLSDGLDLGIQQSEAPRAGNVLATQLASLDFAPEFGIDKKYFLESEFQIQTASFKAYCVQRLLEHRINVVNVVDVVQTLFSTSSFLIGSSENDGALIV